MGELKGFIYTTSRKGALLLGDFAEQKRDYIMEDYTFVEKPGETAAFEDMLELAGLGKAKKDKLYIETLKDLPAQTFEQFREVVQRLYDAGLRTIYSIEEPECNKTVDLLAAVDVLWHLLPEYKRKEQWLLAVAFHKRGISPEEISGLTGLPLSAVHEAIASYLKEQEENGSGVEVEEEIIEVEAED